MTYEELVARTAERKAAGENQTYPAHRDVTSAPRPAANRIPLDLFPCAHLGERLPGQPCGSPLMRCTLHDAVTTRFVRCDRAPRHCATCPDRTPTA